VFLDKDGTLIDDLPYNVDPARIALADGAAAALARLRDAGFTFVVVSNQPGVARGRFAFSALEAVEARLAELFRAHALDLADCRWCPHDARATVEPYARACDCRKPAPGLITDAATRHDIDLARSWMIGDILDDVEAGHRAGCRAILLDNGHETLWERSPLREPDAIVATWADAASAILVTSSREPAREAEARQ
jgi:histidinol-phosphate phosphatase family protein